MANKVILTNKTALTAKYGASGLQAIQAALTTMIAADRGRNVITTVVYMDDVVQMAKLNAKVVTDAASDPQNKTAVDGVWSALNPVYTMILDGPDVVTQQTLVNTVPGDPDPTIPSDLPYASSAGYSDSVLPFVSPTRIVSRMPGVTRKDLTRVADATPIVRAIMNSVGMKPVPPAWYMAYFGAAMQVSQTSKIVVTNVFGGADGLAWSPPSGPEWSTLQYQQMAQYFGLHGAKGSPRWYGDDGAGNYPVALESRLVSQQTSLGMMCTSLACYGAQLFAAGASDALPLCNTYVGNGALAFFGSTNSSFSGPRAGNPQFGDLFCQTFMQKMLGGGSAGAMLLNARTAYAAGVGAWDPTQLKTMAQFLTYGDPSFPIGSLPAAAEVESDVPFADAQAIAGARRLAAGSGQVPVAVPAPALSAGQAAIATIAAHAARSGWGSYAITSYRFERPSDPGADLAAEGLADALHMATVKITRDTDPVPIFETIEVFERRGQVVDVRILQTN